MSLFGIIVKNRIIWWLAVPPSEPPGGSDMQLCSYAVNIYFQCEAAVDHV